MIKPFTGVVYIQISTRETCYLFLNTKSPSYTYDQIARVYIFRLLSPLFFLLIDDVMSAYWKRATIFTLNKKMNLKLAKKKKKIKREKKERNCKCIDLKSPFYGAIVQSQDMMSLSCIKRRVSISVHSTARTGLSKTVRIFNTPLYSGLV